MASTLLSDLFTLAGHWDEPDLDFDNLQAHLAEDSQDAICLPSILGHFRTEIHCANGVLGIRSI